MRSRSGTGTLSPVPNMSADATCLGIWSTVLAREDVLRAERLEQHPAVEQRGRGCARVGLPR